MGDDATEDLCGMLGEQATELAEYETPDPDAKRVADELAELLVDVGRLCQEYETRSVAGLIANLRRRLSASVEAGGADDDDDT